MTRYHIWSQTNFTSLESALMSALTGKESEKGEKVVEWEEFDPNENPNDEPEKTALLMEKVRGLNVMEVIRMDGERVKSIVKIRRTPQTEGDLFCAKNTDALINEIGNQIHKNVGEEDDTVINFVNTTNTKITFNSINKTINRVQPAYKVYTEEYIPKNEEAPDLSKFETGPTDVELSNNFVRKCIESDTPSQQIVQVMESIKGVKEIVFTQLYSINGTKYSIFRIERDPPTEGDLLAEGTKKLKAATKQIKNHLKRQSSSSRINLIRSIEFVKADGVSVVFKK